MLCRFLGNACIELIGVKDHIIIDPVFLTPPRKEIEWVFITHHHQDHITENKLNEIKENYSFEDKKLEVYGPECLFEELNIGFTLIIPGVKIRLNNGEVKVLENSCWKAEGCIAYLISIDNKRILHTADSAVYSNQLYTLKYNIDLCFVACFVENFEDYLKFIKQITPKQVIPYHFTPQKEENAKKLVQYLKENGINSHFLNIGEEIEV
ncbi:MAG: MBL fold metallo-hydrolase [Candidatus Hodarchaeota archaeon]